MENDKDALLKMQEAAEKQKNEEEKTPCWWLASWSVLAAAGVAYVIWLLLK